MVALGVTVICAPVAPVLQVIVPEQLVAVKVALLPAQIVEAGPTEMLGTFGLSTNILIAFEVALLQFPFLQIAV